MQILKYGTVYNTTTPLIIHTVAANKVLLLEEAFAQLTFYSAAGSNSFIIKIRDASDVDVYSLASFSHYGVSGVYTFPVLSKNIIVPSLYDIYMYMTNAYQHDFHVRIKGIEI